MDKTHLTALKKLPYENYQHTDVGYLARCESKADTGILSNITQYTLVSWPYQVLKPQAFGHLIAVFTSYRIYSCISRPRV